MNILHINSYYAVGSFYKGLYDAQIKNDNKLTVYIPVPKGMIVDEKQKGDYVLIRNNHGKYDRVAFHIKHRKILKDTIKNLNINDYNIIHAHSLFSNGYIAYKLKQQYETPYIVAVRNTDVNIFFKYMIHLRCLGNKIMLNADKVVFISEPYRDFVLKKYVSKSNRNVIESKCVVIPNGIDSFWLSNINTHQRSFNANKINLVFAGTIERNKNIATAINACKKLIAKGYKVNYTVVGKIVDQAYFDSFATEPFVTYLAPKTKEELAELYKKQDIFIMPSKTETFGLVYPEAMSQGLPVIYSKGQGFDKQFPDGKVGYPVDCMDAAGIAEAVEKVLENYNDISKRCTELCVKFDWRGIANQYKIIYRYVI